MIKKFCKSCCKNRVKANKYFYLIFFLILTLFMMAYIHNNNIAYIIMFFTFSSFVSSFVIGRKNISNIDVNLLDNKRFFANEEMNLKAIVSGNGFDININNNTITILKEKEIITLNYFPKKRGVFKIDSLTISSKYPFGISEVINEIELKKEILIYPQIAGKSLDEAKSIGFDEEFSGIRSYQKSDKLSQIYWPSVAKGEMASKSFNSGEDKKGELVFDLNRISGDLEFKLSQLTKWIIEAEQRNLNFKLKLNENIIDSKKGIDEILKIIATY